MGRASASRPRRRLTCPQHWTDLHRVFPGAAQASDRLGQPGHLVEFNATKKMFSNPDNEATEAYISGRFG